MSISICHGNLFDSEMQTLVNATNTQGVMGGGIALAFKELYPDMYESYKFRCSKGEHKVTLPYLWHGFKYQPDILNLATKDKVREPSKIDHIAAGLSWVVENYEDYGITSIAFPALGCGLGGLRWRQVQPILMGFCEAMDIPVEVYLPQ